jgi:hypothetical protein
VQPISALVRPWFDAREDVRLGAEPESFDEEERLALHIIFIWWNVVSPPLTESAMKMFFS